MKIFVQIVNKYKISLITFTIFILIGLIAWGFRNIMYLYLFVGIGFLDSATRILIQYFPKARQFFRLSLQFTIGFFLLIWFGLFVGVNFQFPEIFFDTYAGIITGAAIQLIVARLILPFFLGNGFCSRACWTGFFFEMTNPIVRDKGKIRHRSNYLAWGYLISLACLSIFVAFIWNPATNFEIRKWWIICENLFIVSTGFILTFFIGSRAYCRMLCPFMTISGLLSPYSLFKITPINTSKCTSCMLCDKKCPMLIKVETYVNNNKRINDPNCILCERCISECKEGVLKLTTKNELANK